MYRKGKKNVRCLAVNKIYWGDWWLKEICQRPAKIVNMSGGVWRLKILCWEGGMVGWLFLKKFQGGVVFKKNMPGVSGIFK